MKNRRIVIFGIICAGMQILQGLSYIYMNARTLFGHDYGFADQYYGIINMIENLFSLVSWVMLLLFFVGLLEEIKRYY